MVRHNHVTPRRVALFLLHRPLHAGECRSYSSAARSPSDVWERSEEHLCKQSRCRRHRRSLVVRTPKPARMLIRLDRHLVAREDLAWHIDNAHQSPEQPCRMWECGCRECFAGSGLVCCREPRSHVETGRVVLLDAKHGARGKCQERTFWQPGKLADSLDTQVCAKGRR